MHTLNSFALSCFIILRAMTIFHSDLDYFRERLHTKRIRSDTKESRRGP